HVLGAGNRFANGPALPYLAGAHLIGAFASDPAQVALAARLARARIAAALANPLPAVVLPARLAIGLLAALADLARAGVAGGDGLAERFAAILVAGAHAILVAGAATVLVAAFRDRLADRVAAGPVPGFIARLANLLAALPEALLADLLLHAVAALLAV